MGVLIDRSYHNHKTTKISANQPVKINSVVPVNHTDGILRELDVYINLPHSYTGDIYLTLISPDGNRVKLISGLGREGDNFEDTVFDDQATASISTGTAPFKGRWKPEESFRSLIGKSPKGNWTLEVDDKASGDGGELFHWAMFMKVEVEKLVYNRELLDARMAVVKSVNSAKEVLEYVRCIQGKKGAWTNWNNLVDCAKLKIVPDITPPGPSPFGNGLLFELIASMPERAGYNVYQELMIAAEALVQQYQAELPELMASIKRETP